MSTSGSGWRRASSTIRVAGSHGQRPSDRGLLETLGPGATLRDVPRVRSLRVADRIFFRQCEPPPLDQKLRRFGMSADDPRNGGLTPAIEVSALRLCVDA